jgi:probable F420-dependent oxidoreductase
MRFTLAYPLQTSGCSPYFAEPGTMIRVAAAAERAGFEAIAMTDHPAPSRKWLTHGGHAAFDPLAALSFCAAATSTLRLMTYLLVLPYRNPLLVARSIATADRLSAGRLDAVVGPGYLRSEFAALGVDFHRRGRLFDEALDVIRRVFIDDEFRFTGAGFTALGVAIEPKPVQMPHPPLWIGGNGARARERAARHGAGWSPVQMDQDTLRTTGSVAMGSIEEVRLAVEDLARRVNDAGRPSGSVKVQLQSLVVSDITDDPNGVLERVAELDDAGVDQLVVHAPPADVERAVSAIEAFGEGVIAQHAVNR